MSSNHALYIGTKLVKAMPMDRLAYNELRGWAVPEDEDPKDKGYLVEYLDGAKANVPGFDGYVSWSPRDVFDKSYRALTGMKFGMAIEALKLGERLARTGWNGKGMHVELVPAATIEDQRFGAHFLLRGVDGVHQTWVPSITDILAEDWHTT